MMKQYVTESSVWMIDEDAMVVARYPRGTEEGGTVLEHPYVDYDKIGKPEPVRKIEFQTMAWGDRVVAVTYEDGRWVRSGAFIPDW